MQKDSTTQQKIIMKCVFGSHLYGTAISGISDKDYKGVFLPDKRQIYLGKIPKSITDNTKKNSDTKNSSEDIDSEIYSLHYFLKLACEGQTVALDMLHCPNKLLIESSVIWEEIAKNRHLFYTKSLDAFVGYARKQAAKYGIKGSRLNDAKRVLDFLIASKVESLSLKLSDVWAKLPEGEHIIKHPPDESHGLRLYEVCGRKLQETASIEYAIPVIDRFYQNYGERAIKAAQNIGVDWKAVSHAFRAAIQVKSILAEGTINFPLKEAKFLKQVKAGELDYQNEAAPKLDAIMDELEELSAKSTLPKKVNRKFWDDFLIKAIDQCVI